MYLQFYAVTLKEQMERIRTPNAQQHNRRQGVTDEFSHVGVDTNLISVDANTQQGSSTNSADVSLGYISFPNFMP